jgi:hypothetical protein
MLLQVNYLVPGIVSNGKPEVVKSSPIDEVTVPIF